MHTPTTSTWDPHLHALSQALEHTSFSTIHILTDSHTAHHCLPKLVKYIPQLTRAVVHKVDAGEQSKSLSTAERLWNSLNDRGADRNSCLLALGGGVVTDLGGFVAGTFRRGISFMLIPTTLLAMVDAAIGGKTGVNLGSLKNHVGMFAAPQGIYISTLFLPTLSSRELRSGYAEMLKHGLIADGNYWEKCTSIPNLDLTHIQHLIMRSIEIKEDIVKADPFEQYIRKALNFGHTIGHTLESLSLSSKPLLHGEAIALGMIAEAHVANCKGLLSDTSLENCVEGIRKFFPELQVHSSPEMWWPYLQKDKKNRGTTVKCTLLADIGKPLIDVTLTLQDLSSLAGKINESAR